MKGFIRLIGLLTLVFSLTKCSFRVSSAQGKKAPHVNKEFSVGKIEDSEPANTQLPPSEKLKK